MNIGIDRSKLAKNDEEFLDLFAHNTDGIARSIEDVRQLYEAKQGAFAKISEDDFNTFLTSLEFDRYGRIVTGSYKSLMSSLTLNDLYEVFENFGMDRQFFSRNQEAKCNNGACEWEWGSFCATITCTSHVKRPVPVIE
jgi:hypothetical protein